MGGVSEGNTKILDFMLKNPDERIILLMKSESRGKRQAIHQEIGEYPI